VAELQAIVFDLDDTLYPERQYVASGFGAVSRWVEDRTGTSSKTTFVELQDLFDAESRSHTFDAWLNLHGLEPARFLGSMIQIYRGHDPVIRPFDGAERLLQSLHERCRLGLVSDGALEVQKRKLEALGLRQHFDSIIFSDELGRRFWKPSTVPFSNVLSGLGSPPYLAVYIADNPAKDFLGAKEVGMRTIRCRHPQGLHFEVDPPSSTHAAELEIRSLSEIIGALEHLEPMGR